SEHHPRRRPGGNPPQARRIGLPREPDAGRDLDAGRPRRAGGVDGRGDVRPRGTEARTERTGDGPPGSGLTEPEPEAPRALPRVRSLCRSVVRVLCDLAALDHEPDRIRIPDPIRIGERIAVDLNQAA